MTKLDNHIFLIICEVALEQYRTSKFLTFINYCRHMAGSLRRGDLSGDQIADFCVIVERLDLIFTMTPEKTGQYISAFFNSERILEFEKYVTLNQQINPKL